MIISYQPGSGTVQKTPLNQVCPDSGTSSFHELRWAMSLTEQTPPGSTSANLLRIVPWSGTNIWRDAIKNRFSHIIYSQNYQNAKLFQRIYWHLEKQPLPTWWPLCFPGPGGKPGTCAGGLQGQMCSRRNDSVGVGLVETVAVSKELLSSSFVKACYSPEA